MGFWKKIDIIGLLCNYLWSSCLLAPFVVIYWRGTWDLLENYVYPDEPKGPVAEDAPGQDEVSGIGRQASGLFCWGAGLLVRIGLNLCHHHLGEILSTLHPILRHGGGWLYNAIFALAGVSFWRGSWFLMQLDLGLNKWLLAGVLLCSLSVLVACRVTKSLPASPMALALDQHEITFSSGTFFKRLPSDGLWFFVDVIFTNIIIRQLVVFSWWSLWSLENDFFSDQNMGETEESVSYDSLLLGYFCSLVVLVLDQFIISLTTTKLWIIRVLNVTVTLLAFFTSVNIWRGIWSMLNHYFLPNVSNHQNYLVSHFLGLIVLSLLRCSNTIANDAVVHDDESNGILCLNYWGDISSKKSSKQGQEELVPIIE